ncbi:Transcriptional regulator OS=Streptomyces antimycoticus OX=68175 GN=SSPO_058160 PE=3 SV=1 [Streptomyces antimycoticus]
MRTIEYNTGLRIDHYAEIGFAGFVNVVNSVGGVDIDIPTSPSRTRSRGADLKAGMSDAGRPARPWPSSASATRRPTVTSAAAKNQQKFLAALAKRAAQPDQVFVPWKSLPTVGAGLDTLIVDKGSDLRTLMSLFQAMKRVSGGDGNRLNVPVADRSFATSKGDALKWDEGRAKRLFERLRNDQPVGRRG